MYTSSRNLNDSRAMRPAEKADTMLQIAHYIIDFVKSTHNIT